MDRLDRRPSPRSWWPAERGQRRDPAQAPQPGHYRGVGTVAAICVIAASRRSLAIQGGQHGVERGLIGQLQARRGEGVQPQPQFVLAGPCLPAGVDDPLPQQQFRETMPGRSARPPTSPPPPRQRPDPLQGLVVIPGTTGARTPRRSHRPGPRDHRSRVHIQSNTRTLILHWGLPILWLYRPGQLPDDNHVHM